MVIEGLFQFIFVKTVHDIEIKESLYAGFHILSYGLYDRGFPLAELDPGCAGSQFPDQTRVVRMQVGNKKIGLFQIHVQ